ncbi:MAG: SURF1 family protein [Alphaproteobacteria bacterium]|nr:SURF1 family protein [Alphaproteobacteria bacterium]
MRVIFQPGLAVATTLGCAALVSLGSWQLHRLAWKRDLVAKVEARLEAAPRPLGDVIGKREEYPDPEYVPVKIAGAYRHSLTVRVFGTLDGEAGHYLFTPFNLTTPVRSRDVIYVNRGFVPQDVQFTAPLEQTAEAGQVTIEGLLRTPEKPNGIVEFIRPRNDEKANIWYVRRPSVFAKAAGIDALDVYVDSSGKEFAAEWPRGGTTRVEFPNRHLEYALTWFGLAGALLAVFGAFSIRRE